MTRKILTDEDIKKVWDNIIVVSIDNVSAMLAGGGIKVFPMSNGYTASLSLDVLSERISIYHLSVNSSNGKPDSNIANRMAQQILGNGYKMLTVGKLSGCIQFMKEKIDVKK